MLVGRDIVPLTDKYVLSQDTQGFKDTELDLLKYVQNRNLINIDKLPSVEHIKEMYYKDSQISEARVNFACEMYERKIDMYQKYAAGADLRKIRLG